METMTDPRRQSTITIPGQPPSKANQYRIGVAFGSGGRRSLRSTAAVRDYSGLVAKVMHDAKLVPIAGPIALYIESYPPNRKADLTGAEKIICDSLQNWRRIGRKKLILTYGAYFNDSQLDDFRICYTHDVEGERVLDSVNPRLVVTITPLAP
jgi:hypothetical protein